MRFIPFALALIAFSSSPSAYELDYYSKFGHIDNYGNLDLRNKPYTELPSDLVIKGMWTFPKRQLLSCLRA